GTHPYLRTGDGKAMPVLAVSDIGKGRSLALMSDSSWRWGFGVLSVAEREGAHRAGGRSSTGSDGEDGDEGEDALGRTYQKFWENAIRWLIRDPELRLLRVETDQTEYGRADKVHLRVRAL